MLLVLKGINKWWDFITDYLFTKIIISRIFKGKKLSKAISSEIVTLNESQIK